MFDRLQLDLGRETATLARHAGIGRRRERARLSVPLATGGSATLAEALAPALAELGGARLRLAVTLDDGLAHLFMVTPPGNAERLDDCLAAAQMRFHALYDLPPDDWTLRADWDARSPFLACALPRERVDAITAFALAHRLRLVSLQPAFVARWNRWRCALAADAWFGSVGEASLTLGVLGPARLAEVHTLALPPAPEADAAWLHAQVAHLALQLAAPMPARLQLCGAPPGDWLDETADALPCTRLDAAPAKPDDAPGDDGVALARQGAQP